ncbi:hypothetical protein CROQUDRAFT_650042 [Cronartium quercuum f. sp. fusiforme G11]|uniref:Uncharacterized protein n=1 Tax=Cronartium quercuum f. sp. fusiforme G11 TaxID=708437 RepID=A0A9P6NYQ7_9BASI|nr:hypothetical protein CROQUDRAFT_650042 [Cronartium quercuum f. sp. fusiforme G11]
MHFIKQLIGSKNTLLVQHFDKHWHLDRTSVQRYQHTNKAVLKHQIDLQVLACPTPIVSDPIPIHSHGRPASVLNQSKRDRSTFGEDQQDKRNWVTM